jgi:hypothetical protein
MSRKSFLTCPHKNIQQFTECCLDCGYNVYTTREQYLESLKYEVAGKRAAKGKHGDKEARALERELGIDE